MKSEIYDNITKYNMEELMQIQLKRSICLIEINQTCITGFLCLIPLFNGKKIRTLITSGSLVNEEILNNEISINLIFDNGKISVKMRLNKDRIIFINKTKNNNEIMIIEILKNIGCEKDIFYKNDNFDYVDLKRFKRNLNLLTALHLDKFELSKVLCQCDEILDMDSEIIENTINELKDYLEDEDIIRQIIYMNPYILTYNYLELINGAKDVFNKYNVDIKKQKYILEENPNIITLGKECIERSLDIIKKMSTSHESFIENIVDNPIIIGIEDEKLILKNISELYLKMKTKYHL